MQQPEISIHPLIGRLLNNSGSIVGASYKATIAVLPATYQSERDATKDYAFFIVK